MNKIWCSALGCSLLALPFATIADTNCVSPPSGLVSWWRAEGDPRDLAGVHHGTLVNETVFAPGIVGQAFSFNGTSAYVRLPDNWFPCPPSSLPTTPFSFETWFKTLSGGVILGQQSGIPYTAPDGWVPGIYVGTDGKLRTQVFWPGEANLAVSSQSVADGVFHHVAVTFDGTNQSSYLDGQLILVRTFTPTAYSHLYNYQLGIGYTAGWPAGNGGWFPFNGLIDEPSLYTRSLSSSEVVALFLAGTAGKCIDVLPPAIVRSPARVESPVGSAVVLDLAAKGTPPLAYQWQWYGTNLPQATNATLTLANLSPPQGGPYSVFVTNAFGSAQSATGLVTVTFPILVDAPVSNNLPYPGAGNLELPGAQDVYSFTSPANRIVYFDVISSFNRLFWTLTAPDGSRVFTGRYLPNGDTRRIELPMPGSYQLTVYNDSGVTGLYSFKIHSVRDEEFTMSVGSMVTNGVPAIGAGSIEMPGSQDTYFFTAPANRIVFFDVTAAFNRLFWSLTAPDGSAVFTRRYLPNDDTERVELPLPGSYRLRVYSDDITTGTYGFKLGTGRDNVVNVSIGDTVTNGVPGVGAGNLESSGVWDDYLFTAPPNKLVYFDVLSAPFRYFWTLYDPNGETIFANRFMPNNDVKRLLLPRSGSYRLRVAADNADTGGYSFRLSSIVDQACTISLGSTITTGVPEAGAGNLEMPGSIDDYTFTAPTNRLVYFSALSTPFRLFWSLTAPDGRTIFNGRYMPNDDIRRVELPMLGTYHLRVSSDVSQTGPYSFRINNIQDQTIAINPGDLVSNALPVVGSGNLEMSGSADEYTFTAPTNRVVFLGVLSAPYRLYWTLTGPDNLPVFTARYMPNNDVRRVELPTSGQYRLRVNSDTDSTGPYSFKLWAMADQSFAINIGDTVTNGVPGVGSGVLETPGAQDTFTFTAEAGRRVRFDDRDAAPRLASWWLDAPEGSGQVFFDNLDGNDPGAFTLPVTGVYSLRVRNNSDSFPVNYSFALLDLGSTNVSPTIPDAFTIGVGDLVSNGVPALGAGNLETVGHRDRYSFTAIPGQLVYFEDRGSSPNGQLRYDLYDASWTLLFGEWLNGNQELGRRQLVRGGNYYIIASGNNGTTAGNYSFKLWPLLDQSFHITFDALISNGVPSNGAGNIETPGVVDRFTFQATAGQTILLQDLGAQPNGQIRYDVYDDRGSFLFGEWLNNNQDTGRQTLARGGEYTIVVSGYGNTVGTYGFKLWLITGRDQSFAINPGDTIGIGQPTAGAGILESPGVYDTYSFNVAPGQDIYFEDRGAAPNGQFRYDIYDSSKAWLFGEWLNTGQDIGRQTMALGGTYTIVVSGYGDAYGTYSFKLWSVGEDQKFAIKVGDTITYGGPTAGAGNIESPGTRDIYTFSNAPGTSVFFEDRGATPNGQFRYDLFDDRNVYLFGEWLNFGQDLGRRLLSRGGTYTLIVSGYQNATGTYSLRLWPVTDETFVLHVGDVVTNGSPVSGAGNLEAPGVHDHYTFTSLPGQLVYFEDRGATPNGQIRYDVYDEDWTALRGEWLNSYQDVGLFRLSRGGTYHVVASHNADYFGTYSFRFWDALPVILAQPLSVRGLIGQPQTLSVRAESPFPLNYQWRLSGTNLPDGTNAILFLRGAIPSQAGSYDVTVANDYGTITSMVATVTLDASEFLVSGLSPAGPVATNVSQLQVQFNSPVQPGQFDKSDIQITGPNGTISSDLINFTSADARTFLIGIGSQSTEGAYTVIIGPGITNQVGMPLTGGGFSMLYSTSFDAGVGPAWSRGETATNTISARYLGELANDTATLLLGGLPPHHRLRLVWDALILDTWDGDLSPGPDYLGFRLSNHQEPAWEYTFHSSGNPLIQTYPGTPEVSFFNLAGQGSIDCFYRDLQFDFPHTNDTLEVGFYGRNLQGVADEGWGLDNVRVLGLSSSNGTYTGRFVIDKTGPILTNISLTGTIVDPISSVEVNFNEPIQAQSFTTNDVDFIDPFGAFILVNPPQRLSAATYRLNFPLQRGNGAYSLRIGSAILDLAGNSMRTAASRSFTLLTPPIITSQPVSQTVVRNNTATFTVTANTTPPAAYQWRFNGTSLPTATNSTLILLNVQTNQSGDYQVMITDAGGSITSAAASLTVLQNYGPFIAETAAARSTLPVVPGNGVSIELYNGVGGGVAPTPALISNLPPSGTTLSPVIDFPAPGTTISVGSSFNNFFQNTATPPDQVLGLAAANFVLRHTFYLSVSRTNDLHPETSEIDLSIGVGSDDGFSLLAGTNFIGSAGDRGFNYSWMDISFENEGLYPFELLYAANAVGASGLELSWKIGTNASTQIIPQAALYISPDLGDRLITFEEVPVGTVLSNQFATTGVVFTTISGFLQVITNFPARFLPVSPAHVLGDPDDNPSVPGILDLSFVTPDPAFRATTDFVSFFLINAQHDVQNVTAFDSGGNLIFTNSYHGGGASQELVTINRRGISRVRINLGQGTNAAAIDNLAYLAPISLPDLIVDQIVAPTNVAAGQPVQLVWRVTNQGSRSAQGVWTDAVALSPSAQGSSPQPLASISYSNFLAVGASLTVTQAVIIPATQVGTRYFLVTANANHSFQESGNLTNNTGVAAFPTVIVAPDLEVTSVTAPASAQLGQTLNLSWVVRNSGTASADVTWEDRVWLSASSNSISGAISLLTTVSLGGLPPSSGYTNNRPITLPLGTLAPGPYYLFVQTDAGGSLAEPNESNNLLSAPILLTLPPLPDLRMGSPISPTAALPGQFLQVTWSLTNFGATAAVGPWREILRLVPDGLTLGQFLSDPTSFPVLGVFSFSNSLPSGSSVTRTQQVAIPFNGPAGNVRIAAFADSEQVIRESDESNNAALGNLLQLAATLVLAVPTSSVLENTTDPNLACLVSRNGDLSASLVVTLASSAPALLRVPSNLTIPAGSPAAPFTATVLNDGVFGPDVTVSISAQAPGHLAAASQVQVVNTDIPHLGISLSSSQLVEGQTVTARVTSDVRRNEPVDVTVVTGSSRLITPATVTIPANSNSVQFTLLAVDNTVSEPTHGHTISVSAVGCSGSAAELTVFDNDTPTLLLMLDRASTSEGDGPLAVVGTVTRGVVIDQPLVVALTSSNFDAALVPAQVIIPPLQASATFPIAAVNDGLLSGPKMTTISAQPLDALGNLVGNSAIQPLVVQDDDGPTLQVFLANTIVSKASNPATTATVSRNTPPTNSLVLTLTSGDTNSARVPATLTIPVGQTNATFSIVTLDDGQENTGHAVLISAAAVNFASGSALLLVTDIGLPDLAVRGITSPGSAFTEEAVPITFRLLNQGLGALTNPTSQNVFISTDPSFGKRVLVGTVPFGGPLSPGQFVDQSILLPGSALMAPGTYWVMVTADSGGGTSEISEANNSSVSALPFLVANAYTATVKASASNVVAGTSVPLSGSATLAAGGPAVNKPVNILLSVRGLQRIFSVFTDANGNFSTLFTPFPGEAGRYSVAAAGPGVTNLPAQDEFSIFGATLKPASMEAVVVEGSSVSLPASMQNLSEIPLTGLTATTSGLAANLTATPTLSSGTLESQGTLTLSVVISAEDATIRQSSFTIQVTSSEGVTLKLPVTVTVQPLLARLASSPPQINASMLRGAQSIVQFDVVNLGGAASGPLTVNVPPVPWLSVASTNPLSSLNPGESNRITLLLTPSADLPLGPYTGALTVTASGTGLTVPFTFNAVSDGHGTLRIHSTDEFTYFAAGAPPLTNADITLTDPFSGAIVASGNTGTNGVFIVTNLLEGTYELAANADKHAPIKSSAVVIAGRTNDLEVFLSRQTVSFTWSVVPTQIQDVTKITVLAEFEANVPAPVVVPTPTSFDLAALDEPGKFIDVPLTLANHGLIAVHGVTINISDSPFYRFDLLTRDVGILPAHGTVTVPMRITRLAVPSHMPKAADPCIISFSILYLYLCGSHDISNAIGIPLFGLVGDCGASPGIVVIVGGPGGPGGPVLIPPGSGGEPTDCDPCMAKAIIECAIGFTPAGCGYGSWSCGLGLLNKDPNAVENCVNQLIGCVGGPYGNAASCLWSFFRCKCPGTLAQAAACAQQALGGGKRAKDESVGLGLSPFDPRDVYVARSYYGLQWLGMILGDPDGRWFSPGSGGALEAWMDGFNQTIQTNGPSGMVISGNELSTLLSLPRPNGINTGDVQATVARWNLSITNWRAHIYSVTNVPPGGDTNFIDLAVLGQIIENANEQDLAAQAAGYVNPIAGFFAAINDAKTRLTGGGVCARVVLQLDQDAVLTRDAFRATLQLNNSGADPLFNVTVNLMVRNTAGQDVTSLFGILPPTLGGSLTGVDGNGLLTPNSTGTAQWTLIPTQDAAPQAPTNYLVSGSFSFVQNGVTITIPLAPAQIKVQPNPRLFVKYFHQRDVFADDPFTPEIERSIPYSLAVMVQNRGYGLARDFHIISAQPKIVENEKGLLIDFKIVGSQVGTNPVAPSLTADFGNIPPHTTEIARWLLTSTLQGLFINYQARFQHVDPLGNPRLSLIEGVEIHELIHLVRATDSFDDGHPDFLVNDMADFNDLPDTLHLSDGTVQPISVVQTASTDGPASAGHLQVRLTANLPAGFSYVRVADPGGSQFRLVDIRRGNGTSLMSDNFWTTDRTFIGLGQRPIRENILHLFVLHTNAGPETYTLVYASPASVVDTNPPVSAVFSLPARSPQTFGVVWNGADFAGESGLAAFDIFYSENNGPFKLWQARTTTTGALFHGTAGHTYAFYSLAIDQAGNVEASPSTPDATTTVSLSNTPPAISFSGDIVVNEGDNVSVTPTVSDTDLPPETFTFELGPGAPAGITLHPATGLINWPTSELDGPGTNVLRVVVRDNGFPPLSATGTVRVIVKEVNSAPTLSPVANYTINEGSLLVVTNTALDYDIPGNRLSFRLGSGAPLGARMDTNAGVFTWRPNSTQGPGTNLIRVTVTDSGDPPLTATQQFTVVVRDTLSDVSVTVGATNVMAGENGSLAIWLGSTLELTNLSFQLQVDTSRLTNLVLQAATAEVTSTTLQPAGSNLFAASLSLDPSRQTSSARILARLTFLATTHAHSAIVPLDISQPMALRPSGQFVANTLGADGRVIVIAEEPVLELRPGPAMVWYGHPGTIGMLEYRTNVSSGSWLPLRQVTISDRAVPVLLDATEPRMFFRAYEFPGFTLGIDRLGIGSAILTMEGQTGAHYTLQATTNLSAPRLWTDLFGFTLTNRTQTFNWTNPGVRAILFRMQKP